MNDEKLIENKTGYICVACGEFVLYSQLNTHRFSEKHIDNCKKTKEWKWKKIKIKDVIGNRIFIGKTARIGDEIFVIKGTPPYHGYFNLSEEERKERKEQEKQPNPRPKKQLRKEQFLNLLDEMGESDVNVLFEMYDTRFGVVSTDWKRFIMTMLVKEKLVRRSIVHRGRGKGKGLQSFISLTKEGRKYLRGGGISLIDRN